MGSCPRTRCWTIVVIVTLASGVAWADSALDDARSAVDSSDYMAARTALDKALHAGGASPDEVAEIYKLSGIVAGALGETETATTAFAKWLELDAKGTLPPGTSPKIAKPFKAAAEQAKKTNAIEVKAETIAKPPSVRMNVLNDPSQLVASTHVIVVADGKREVEVDGKPGAMIALPMGRRLDLRVQALDEFGNRVFELGSKSVPLVITGGEPAPSDLTPKKKLAEKPPEPEMRSPRAWYWKHQTWGIATVVMVAATGFFAWEVRSDLADLDKLNRNSLDHPFQDAQAVESNAHRDVLIADLTAGAAGVFALGTIYLYLTRPPEVAETPITAVPVRGGAAIVFGGHF
jgi:hypothetical protein